MSEYKLNKDKVVVPFGPGSIVLEEISCLNAEGYGEVPVILSRTITFEEPEWLGVPLISLKDMYDVCTARKIDISESAKQNPVGLATMLAKIEGMERVLYPSMRFSGLEKACGFDLTANRPRVEGDSLRFLVGGFNVQSGEYDLKDVTVKLTDLTLTATRFRKVSVNRGPAKAVPHCLDDGERGKRPGEAGEEAG